MQSDRWRSIRHQPGDMCRAQTTHRLYINHRFPLATSPTPETNPDLSSSFSTVAMAWPSLLSVFLCFLVFFHACSAGRPQQQQNQCDIRNLNAAEPSDRFQSEAGVTEFWDQNNEQFRCAGAAAYRRTIEPRGLLLPSYSNAPILAYVVQGRGIQGTVLPGCPETFQSFQQFQHQESQMFQDRHQKIRSLREGDVFAIPAGSAYWAYNDGESKLVIVALLDTANDANQLDFNPRRFFLAGNPPSQNEQQGQRPDNGNIFRGFDSRILAEAFGVDEETARRLQGENDKRGAIVRAKDGLQVLRPFRSPEEQGQGSGNALEETICTMRMGENLDDPSRADFFNPRAGRLSSLNKFNLPILEFLQLSAEKGVLRKNALFAPHWNMNAHSVVYALRGEARCQIVNHRGQTVFDGSLRQGQMVVVPQNFAVLKRAGNQGFEWVAFKTNENAMFNTIAGRTSTMRGLPLDVIANAYRISQDEARKLKFGRDETAMFSPFTSRPEDRASA